MTLEQDPPPEAPEDTVPEAAPIPEAELTMTEESPIDSPAGSPTAPLATPPAPPTSETLALDNARGGRWAMNEYFDGLVWLGADNKPVMRQDRSRVGFYFRDAPRLAGELAAASGSATESDSRPALAPLDAGFDDDWDPQAQKSYLATMTKMTRLLAYDYVRTTEPEEAVRKAVSTIFGNPKYIDEPGMKVWVPGKYDLEAVKSVAAALRRQGIGSEQPEAKETSLDDVGAKVRVSMAPVGAYMRGDPRRATIGRNGSRADEQAPNSGKAISERTVDDDRSILEIETQDESGENIKRVANIWPNFQGPAQFIVNGGPEVVGPVDGNNPRVDHKPEHFHLRLKDGRTIRYLAGSFEVHPYDKDKDGREHDKIIRRLTPEQREYLTKATNDIFQTGKISAETKGFLANKIIKRHPRVD